MPLKNINLILSNSPRSIAYINALKKNKIMINLIIFYGFKKKFTLSQLPKSNKVKYFSEKKINNKIINYLINTNETYFFISPYKSEIIKHKKFLNKLKILHFHPGKLPFYKGSTILYYTKLAKKNFYCSCFRLQTKIDSGEVYFQNKFKNLKFNEFNYDDVDNQIRSKTLVALLKTKRLKLKINKNNNRFQNYYIIHPILRKISVNNEFKESLKNFLFKKLF